mgnify:FL=1
MLDPATQYAEDIDSGKIIANKWMRLACARHLHDLDTCEERGLWFDYEAAQYVIDFFPSFLVFYEGDFDGEPFVLTPCQAFIIGSIFGWKREKDNFRRFRTAYIEMAKGQGKAVAIDTPVPTPTGWSRMESLGVGDEVFDESGKVCKVTAVTGVLHDRDCFKLSFSGGGSIVADAEHMWRTNAHRHHHRKVRVFPKTTREIFETLQACPNGTKSKFPMPKWNHRIDVTRPLECPEVSLIVDPYVLGVWLGDGDSDSARITCSDLDYELIETIRARGYTAKRNKSNNKTTGRYRIQSTVGKNLQTCLRELNVLRNKHVPKVYLRGSFHQRLELLKGLMDSDGSCDINGQCEYTSISHGLIVGVSELLRTFGVKFAFSTCRAKIYEKDCGVRYRIIFRVYNDFSIFHLKRKYSRLKSPPKTRRINSGFMITGCDPVESVPVKCIEVDSPSHMYLVGEGMIPTHNSPLAGGIGLYCLVFDNEPGAEIYAAAVTREQAGILFRDARTFSEKSDALRDLLEIHRNNIAYVSQNSFFRPVSSEHRGLDGKRPHLALIDEIHEHSSDMVVRKMSAGTKTRRQSLMFEITNAGYDRHSICFQHHEYTEKVLEGIIKDDAWFGIITGLDVCPSCEDAGKTIPQDGCPDCDDWRDPAVWEKANPNLKYLGAPFEDYLKRQVDEAKEMASQENIVKRLNFCIWTESITRWMSADRWESCAINVDAEALRGRACYGGLDLSSNTDLTAWILVFPPEEEGERYEVLCRFFIPEDNLPERVRKDRVPYDVWARQGFITLTPGNIIDYAFILDQVRRDSEDYLIAELAFDRWGSQKITTDLQDIGFEIDGDKTLVQFGQGYASMSAPTKEVETMVLSGKLAHGGNPVLAWNVSNVSLKMDPAGNVKADKEKSVERIDGAVALIMAIGRAMLGGGAVRSAYDGLDYEEIRKRMSLS